MNTSHIGLPGLQMCSLQLGETSIFCLILSFCDTTGKLSLGRKLRQLLGPFCFPSLKDHCPTLRIVQILQNTVSLYLVQFFCFVLFLLLQAIEYNLYYFVLVRSKNSINENLINCSLKLFCIF